MSDGRSVERTGDGRWLVVDGRRWRAADPDLPDDVRARLLHHLGAARSRVRTAGRAGDEVAVAEARERVRLAKTGLGERGPAWWGQDADARRTRWESALARLDGDVRGRG
ncbi:biopolymer transporter Tol [Geodermatophilus sp. YIM 151500]|uniref:biopolymer transporter Tol n=1 Tax=Geodermatophilus sp. YIM 151500 TaxID=2984531 RepID=UPI0021E51078|nr:biopolymer transporter Tol [Geodermatophilus sp. YIM 151500]MCV2489603.1 biopolymer transporter Tol [Geodermatophilus sp. YIM 151500]